MYDAVYLFARGLHGVQNAKNMNFRQNIMCNSSTSWEDGISLLNYMKTVCLEDIYQITRILNSCTYLKLVNTDIFNDVLMDDTTAVID